MVNTVSQLFFRRDLIGKKLFKPVDFKYFYCNGEFKKRVHLNS